jgi:hypothetical protein
MALNLKPEPIVIKKNSFKIDGSVLSPFHEDNSYAFSLKHLQLL